MKKFIPPEERCTQMVRDTSTRFGLHKTRCDRRAGYDGFCFQHHPQNVAKRRERVEKAREERYNNNPWQQLMRLHRKFDLLRKALERIEAMDHTDLMRIEARTALKNSLEE